jgi:hypothetical protein
MQTRSAAATSAAPGPAVAEQTGASPTTDTHTVALQKHSNPLPPARWQVVKRGMPLGKAVAYCQAKGVKVSMHLMVPEELQHA